MKRKLKTFTFNLSLKKNILSDLIAASVFFMLVTISQIAMAGTTGKISGNVKDAQTGEPLIGASVLIEGTKLGGVTNIDGDYTIINISPGTYRVKARYVGYQDKVVSDVGVRADYTTKVDFDLSSKDIQANEITVVAERPLVTKDQTSSAAVIGSQQIKALPIDNIDQVTQLQAGVVGGHFRGGRKGEVAYLVDGLSVTDVFDGNDGREGSIGVETSNVQELQVITGTFNAEYGQALSGVVSIVTKEGDSKYAGGLTLYGGDYVSGRTSIFQNINNINPISSRNIDANLSGPVPGLGNLLTFYAAGRYFNNDGYLYGTRQYEPTDLRSKEDPRNPYGPTYMEIAGLFDTDAAGNILPDANGHAKIDRQHGKVVYVPYDPTNATLYNVFNGYNNFGTGNNAQVAENPYREYSTQAKLTFKPSATFKVAYNLLYQDETFHGYNHEWSLNPDGDLQQFRTTFTNYLTSTYTLNNNAFLTAGLSRFYTAYKQYVYANANDPRYQNPVIDQDVSGSEPYNNGAMFVAGGTQPDRQNRSTTSYIAKTEFTTQASQVHLIKMGAELRQHELMYDDYSLANDPNTNQIVIPSPSQFGHELYTVKPTEFSAYIQDKMEFKDFIVNIGLRYDYFDPAAFVPRDITDPSYTTTDASLRRKPDSLYLANNGTLDRTRRASIKYAFSPRLGIAFPINEKGVFHFSYGHFFQLPKFELLYHNLLYKFTAADAATTVQDPFGNADLKPQQTVQGEIGVQQQIGKDISLDVTMYFRDIRDLAGTQEVDNFFGGGRYYRYTNSDFGYVRGVVVSVTKRLSNNFNFSVDYTFQIAQGSSSDPAAAAAARNSGALPETQIGTLDFDQRHTLNTTLAYSNQDWTASLIGRYGSGFPYTPDQSTVPGGVSQFLQNSALKPSTFSVDVRASHDIKFGATKITVFTQIYNLFDAANPVDVFNTTGQPDYTLDIVRRAGSLQPLNSLDSYYNIPSFYAEPRRIVLGATVNF
jgi:outer membrane receptor protein involved in Fe transport